MDVLEVGGTRVIVDTVRTRRTYQKIARRPRELCDCAYCRNFRAQGSSAFPPEILDFFARSGIDTDQPAETYELGETTSGKRLYGGEYYFFGAAPLTDGSLLDASRPFDFTFTARSPLAQEEFGVEGSVCFQFIVELPWVIVDAP